MTDPSQRGEVQTDNGKALASLRDLDGVVGSFLLGPTGAVVAQDLPSYFGSAAYEMGPRALRLQEALVMTEGKMNLCMLRYGAHKVSLKPVGEGLLTVIAQSDINVPALRMATNLVTKKLDVALALDPIATSTPPPPTVRPTSQKAPNQKTQSPRSLGAPEAQGARPRKKRAVYFRGKRVE